MTNEHNQNQAEPRPATRGRPKTIPGESKIIGFRFSEKEIEAMTVAATAAGETVAEYVRKAVRMRLEKATQIAPSASISYTTPSATIVDNKSIVSEANFTISVPLQTINTPNTDTFTKNEPSA